MSRSVLSLVLEYARLCPGVFQAVPCPGVCRAVSQSRLGAVSSDTATKRGPACPDLGSMKCSASLVPIIFMYQSGLSTPLPGRRELSLKKKQARKLSHRTGAEDKASAATPSGEWVYVFNSAGGVSGVQAV